MNVLVRPEAPSDVGAIRAVTAAAFRSAPHSAPPVDGSDLPGEATLVDWLRADESWIPELSLVACHDDAVVGHVVCTRGYAGESPALGLGPLSVAPEAQRRGVGSALMTAVIDAAEARGEALIALLGDPGFYGRFGFRPAVEFGVTAPDPAWGDYFQALALRPAVAGGAFRYAAPFARL